ncbi:MAG: zonular occludens toxin domain-containing protein [Hadesarchaea archaeon]|nr:zonular occludens toxin domain-containing protein [Hadesarchaea archaeon]
MGLLGRIRDAFGLGPPKPPPKFEPFEVVEEQKGSYTDFERALQKYGLIMLIVGKRGSGKTALGMQFLAWFNHVTRRRCYGIGYDAAKLPGWIKKARNIDEIPNDSVVLVDEAAIMFFSREAMTSMNKMLTKLMAVARHKNLTMMLITQSSALIEINVLRLADVLLLKEPSLLQARFERKALQDIFNTADKTFKKLDDRVGHFYVYSDEFEGLMRYSLPYFWDDSISRAFREFRGR